VKAGAGKNKLDRQTWGLGQNNGAVGQTITFVTLFGADRPETGGQEGWSLQIIKDKAPQKVPPLLPEEGVGIVETIIQFYIQPQRGSFRLSHSAL